MSEQRKVEMLNEKLAHYNKWLGDAKRPLTQPYPGFPKQKELDVLCGLAQPEPVKQVRTKKAAAKAVKMVRTGTKLDQAREIYSQNLNASRDEVVKLFMDNLSMSKAGATTYWYTVRK